MDKLLNKIWLVSVLAFCLLAGSWAPVTRGLVDTSAPAEQATLLQIRCAPGPGGPHETWNGNQVILKGTVAADAATSLLYTWDYGDGSPPQTGSVTDPYNVAAYHVYPDAQPDTIFDATLTITDTASGISASLVYSITVREVSPELQVNVAIDDGLWYLHTQVYRYDQDGMTYGYWGGTGYDVSTTASAILAFQIQGHLASADFETNPYVDTVRRGLNYLLSQTFQQTIPVQPAGDPDTNGNGYGLYTSAGNRYTLYDAGIAAMALAASGSAAQSAAVGGQGVQGRSHREILQDMVDYLAWAQVDAPYEDSRGGWRYAPNSTSSDMSVTQWPVLAMEAAELNWGVTVPAWVRTELRDHFLRSVQGADGGFGYTDPGTGNAARAGAGLICLAFTDVPSTDPRVINAAAFLGADWTADNIGNLYAMYAIMKGSLLTEPPIDSYTDHDWYEEYSAYLTQSQYPDGHWNDNRYASGNLPLSSAWAILTLSPTVITPGQGGGVRLPPISVPEIAWVWFLPLLLLIPLLLLLVHRFAKRTSSERDMSGGRPSLGRATKGHRRGEERPAPPAPTGATRPTRPGSGETKPRRDDRDRGASRPGISKE